jgi:hypothetical protein
MNDSRLVLHFGSLIVMLLVLGLTLLALVALAPLVTYSGRFTAFDEDHAFDCGGASVVL